MAKSKHSTALFEVIHGARKPDRAAQSLRTPKWWFKSSHSAPQQAPAPQPVQHDPEPVTAHYEAAEPAAPRRSSYSRNERSSGIDVGFDRGRKEFTFKLRYTTALVTGFAVFMLIGLSYVIGRHLGGGPKVANAEQAPVRQLLQQPPQAGVTVVPPKTKNVVPPKLQQPAGGDSTNRTALANPTPPKTTVVSSLVPASADTSMPRKPGLNYLVINSYNAERRAVAEAARDFFNSHGVPCTLEKTEWTMPGGITLLGTAGFNKASGDDFLVYVDRVSKLAKTYKSSAYDHPDPTRFNRYSWRSTDHPY